MPFSYNFLTWSGGPFNVIQAKFFGALNLDDARIVNNNLHNAKAQGGDLLADQLQPW